MIDTLVSTPRVSRQPINFKPGWSPRSLSTTAISQVSVHQMTTVIADFPPAWSEVPLRVAVLSHLKWSFTEVKQMKRAAESVSAEYLETLRYNPNLETDLYCLRQNKPACSPTLRSSVLSATRFNLLLVCRSSLRHGNALGPFLSLLGNQQLSSSFRELYGPDASKRQREQRVSVHVSTMLANFFLRSDGSSS